MENNTIISTNIYKIAMYLFLIFFCKSLTNNQLKNHSTLFQRTSAPIFFLLSYNLDRLFFLSFPLNIIGTFFCKTAMLQVFTTIEARVFPSGRLFPIHAILQLYNAIIFKAIGPFSARHILKKILPL